MKKKFFQILLSAPLIFFISGGALAQPGYTVTSTGYSWNSGWQLDAKNVAEYLGNGLNKESYYLTYNGSSFDSISKTTYHNPAHPDYCENVHYGGGQWDTLFRWFFFYDGANHNVQDSVAELISGTLSPTHMIYRRYNANDQKVSDSALVYNSGNWDNSSLDLYGYTGGLFDNHLILYWSGSSWDTSDWLTSFYQGTLKMRDTLYNYIGGQMVPYAAVRYAYYPTDSLRSLTEIQLDSGVWTYVDSVVGVRNNQTDLDSIIQYEWDPQNSYWYPFYLGVINKTWDGIENIDADSKLSIYPNPVSDIMYLSSESLRLGTVSIFDMLGRKMFDKEITTKNYQLSTINYPSGIYFVKVCNEVRKFVKE